MTKPTREEVEQRGRRFYLNEICNNALMAVDGSREEIHESFREMKKLVLELHKTIVALLDENERLEQEIKQLETKLIDYNPYLKMVKRQAAAVEAARIFAHDTREATRKQLFEAFAKLDGEGR